MTAIACRDGVLVADGSAWVDDLTFGSYQKIRRISDGTLAAGAGYRRDILKVWDWLDEGAEPRDAPSMTKDDAEGFGMIWLRHTGIWMIDEAMKPYPIAESFAAEGSHTEFMLGCMVMGADAEQAVRLAIKHGAFAREPIQVERL